MGNNIDSALTGLAVGSGIGTAAGVGAGAYGGVSLADYLTDDPKKVEKDKAEKTAEEYAPECPGAKINSDGKGRGLGVGQGQGPIGRQAPPCPGAKINSDGMGRGLGVGQGQGPIGNRGSNFERLLTLLNKGQNQSESVDKNAKD